MPEVTMKLRALFNLVVEMRAVLVEKGLMKGAA